RRRDRARRLGAGDGRRLPPGRGLPLQRLPARERGRLRLPRLPRALLRPGGARRLPRVAIALVLAGAIGGPLLFSGLADRAVARVGALFDRNGDPSVTYRVRELRGAVDVVVGHP